MWFLRIEKWNTVVTDKKFSILQGTAALVGGRSIKYELKMTLIITQPTNALIVCHLFLNHFFKTLSLLLHDSIAYRLSSSGRTYSS